MTRHPFRNFSEYARLKQVMKDPLRALRIRLYRGGEQLTHLDLKDGRRIWMRAGTADRHILWGVFLREMYRLGSLESGPRLPCVVDVGAHIGSFSMHVAPFAERLFAFEPVPENFELAARNLSGPRHAHVEVLNQAVGDPAGRLTIHLSKENSGGHSAYLDPEKAAGEAVEVEKIRLPDFLDARGQQRVDLLKMDCEGAEYEILESLEAWGLSRIERVVMEYHPRPGSRGDAESGGVWLEERLTKAGFAVERQRRTNPRQGMLYARRGTA